MNFRLVALDILDPGSLELARRWNDVYVADQAALFGAQGSAFTLVERQGFQRGTDRSCRTVAAVADDGTVVGSLQVVEGTRDNLDTSTFGLVVHPDHRRRGVGSALLDHAEALAAESGRHVLMADSEFPVDGVDGAEEFATARGWSIGQTMPRSALALPGDAAWRERLVALRDGGDVAATADPTAYRIETAVDLPPEEWLDGMALAYRRMSTDMPLGDLAVEEEDWDAARVHEMLSTLLASGRRLVTSMARDRTGAMAGLTEMGVSAGSPHLAYQGSTLVLREHRGQRLGLRLKAANALVLLELLPQVRSIRTWNADDNVPMLAVNRELGFVVDAWERTWQKRLS